MNEEVEKPRRDVIEIIRSLVRPFISVSLVSLTVGLGAFGKLEAKDVLYLTGIVIAFHFGEKSALKVPGKDGSSSQK